MMYTITYNLASGNKLYYTGEPFNNVLVGPERWSYSLRNAAVYKSAAEADAFIKAHRECDGCYVVAWPVAAVHAARLVENAV